MAGRHEKDEPEELRHSPKESKNEGRARSAQDRDAAMIEEARSGNKPVGRHAVRDEQDRT